LVSPVTGAQAQGLRIQLVDMMRIVIALIAGNLPFQRLKPDAA
jgi:hypothetical protein